MKTKLTLYELANMVSNLQIRHPKECQFVLIASTSLAIKRETGFCHQLDNAS